MTATSPAGHGGPIAFLSTFPPQRCGIGSYTSALAAAVGTQGAELPVVISEEGAADGVVKGVRSIPRFARNGDYGAAVVAAVKEIKARVVHVQHAPDILGMDDRLPRLLDALRTAGVASVVTLHTVHTPLSGALERRFRVRHFHRRVGAAADAIVVHGETQMRDELVRQGVSADRVFVIPHGTSTIETADQAESRGKLGVPLDGPLLLYFGFIHIQKNLHVVLRAMATLQGEAANARLLVVGSIQNRAWYNRSYLQWCRRLAAAPALAGRIIIREGFLPTADVPVVYSAADLVLLPYAQGYGSSSGVVHNAIGARRLMLCSRGPKFQEIGEQISDSLLVPAHDAGAWAHRIESLLADAPLRRSLTARVEAYGHETSWPRVAQQHLALYARLVAAKRTAMSALTPA